MLCTLLGVFMLLLAINSATPKHCSLQWQQRVFRKKIGGAREEQLPVVISCFSR